MSKVCTFAVFRERKFWRIQRGGSYGMLRDFLFLVLAFIFLIIWLVSWAALHIAGGLIHVLLLVAVIFLILHFVRGRRTSV
jgi:hypothetical protein